MRFQKDIRALIKYKSLLLILIILAVSSNIAVGQNRKELEDKRKRLIQEINQTTNLLEETKKNKTATLNRYIALQRQIRKRKQLVRTLQQEIDYADESMERAYEVIDALNLDVNRLKAEYANMIRTAYRHKMSSSSILFIFSADNLNDAFKRWQYIKRYDKYRKKQAQLILETQATLQSKTDQLEQRKKEKEKLLVSAQQQQQLLSVELKDKDEILKTLKDDESRLALELSQQQDAHSKLNDAIENIIRKEMALKRKEARSSDALAANKETSTVHLTGDFSKNKGGLPWPVTSGFISRGFGTQPHPTLKEIEITNNGIDIQTEGKANVRAVFEGKVAGTQFIPGYQNTVIVQHGNYYTVYSNLEEVFVKRGDIVKTKQAIGRLGNENAEVHFEVWKEKQRLNPVNWVTKK